jgi:hypothetical protein
MMGVARYRRVSAQRKMVADETWTCGRGRSSRDAASLLAIRKLDGGRTWMAGTRPCCHLPIEIGAVGAAAGKERYARYTMIHVLHFTIFVINSNYEHAKRDGGPA